MRSISLITLLLLSTISISQTSVIALKSHSGDLININLEPDSFGLDEPSPEYDSIIRIGESCIITIGRYWGNNKFQDTICDEDYYYLNEEGYSLKACKEQFGNQPKYIGFKKKDWKNNDAKDKNSDGSEIFWFNGNPNKGAISGLLILVALSFLAYFITPLLRKKHL